MAVKHWIIYSPDHDNAIVAVHQQEASLPPPKCPGKRVVEAAAAAVAESIFSESDQAYSIDLLNDSKVGYANIKKKRKAIRDNEVDVFRGST